MRTLICYPKCSTCKKAQNWLNQHNIKYQERHIVDDNPKKEELQDWIKKYDYPIKKYFNTSGNVYKQLNLKDILPTLSLEEQITLLSTNGMLVKRPLLVSDDNILIGFKEEEWKRYFENE